MIVSECAPAASVKMRELMPTVARHGTGSSPQSMPGTGGEVSPSEIPKSKISNWSPLVNASVTVRNVVKDEEKVQGGGSRNVVGVPELGMQKAPPGSAGSQPAAGRPASVNENS